jgi:NodT family efflux transporter outer membrane factor (OMF) lipoprotein
MTTGWKTMVERKSRIARVCAAGALGVLAMLAGCRVGPHYTPPAPPAITAPNYKESTVNFTDQNGWKVASPQEAMLRGNWWEVFHEPELNALEEQLNVNNQSIKASFENFMAARAMVAEARSQYWPTITANPSYQYARSSSNQNVSSTATTGRTYALWSLPLDASWTPDFWGKIRNQVHAAQYAAQASAADVEVEKLTEQASLAQFFFEIHGQDMLQVILNQTVDADQKSLDYAQAQYETGIGDYIAVAQAKATLESVQSSAVNVGLLRAQYEHAIAMLIGKPATDFSMPVKPLVYTPPAIPTGVPSQLVERRPDVAAAERTIAQANATIGIGYGAFFPQVTLSGSAGLESALLKNLFSLPSGFWSIGPAASQIIFDGGLYRAELHQYQATYNADLASYRQSVLNAFQQVEDYLAATRIYSQQILRQQAAVKDSQDYLNIELQRYQLGLDPYVDVVIAQTTLLNNQSTLNSLQVSQMISAVELVQALGGGWDRSQLPTPAQAGAKASNAEYKLQQ